MGGSSRLSYLVSGDTHTVDSAGDRGQDDPMLGDVASTPEDRARTFPCDRVIPEAREAWYRAVDVAAPAPVLFRWLCQLRAAPYSYDWIDNFGRQSPRTLTPGLDDLAVGQRVMTIFTLTDFERGVHLTARLRNGLTLFGDIAATYLVVSRGERASRLIVKLRLGGGWFASGLGAWLDLVMMRKQLLTLKALAEATAGGT